MFQPLLIGFKHSTWLMHSIFFNVSQTYSLKIFTNFHVYKPKTKFTNIPDVIVQIYRTFGKRKFVM